MRAAAAALVWLLVSLFQPTAANMCGDKCSTLANSTLCGVNGVTYPNECVFADVRCARGGKLQMDHIGACTMPCKRKCGANVQQVCASDGQIYQNHCTFRNAVCENPAVYEHSSLLKCTLK